ncbi:MAG: TolC family protein [Planctomycetaceae bacterium]
MGCATPPAPEPEYAQTAYRVQLAAGSYETGEPATLAVEPKIEGVHGVDFYVRVAIERNPEILAAQRRVAAQAEVIPQATALDDPVLADFFQPITDNSVQTAAGRGPNTLSLSQRFPWFGKLRVRGEVAEQETRIALTRLAQAQLKVVEDVHFAYYELYFNQHAIAITEEDYRLLKDLLKFAEARYRTGQTSQQDVLSAQVELETLKDRLIVLHRQHRQAQADLASLLHTSTESNLRADDVKRISAPEEIDRLYEAATRCRPELQERLHAIVRNQRAEELARLQYYPDVTLGAGWQEITTGSALSRVANGNDNFAFGVGVNLPIWRDKLRAGVSEAEHRVVASARRYDATRDDTYRQIKRLMVQIRALEQQITLFRDSIIPKSSQTLRVSTADYRVGKVDFQQIIDNWSDLLTFQIQLARLRATLGQSMASLERVVGCQLATLPEPRGGAGQRKPLTTPPKPAAPSPNKATKPAPQG